MNDSDDDQAPKCGVCYNTFDSIHCVEVPFEHCNHAVCSSCYVRLLRTAGGDRCPFCRKNMDGSTEERALPNEQVVRTFVDLFGRRLPDRGVVIVSSSPESTWVVEPVGERSSARIARRRIMQAVDQAVERIGQRTSQRLAQQAHMMARSRVPDSNRELEDDPFASDTEAHGEARGRVRIESTRPSRARSQQETPTATRRRHEPDSTQSSPTSGISDRRRRREDTVESSHAIVRLNRGRQLVEFVRTTATNPIDAVDVTSFQALNAWITREREDNDER